jgi:copper chaperone CopZ
MENHLPCAICFIYLLLPKITMKSVRFVAIFILLLSCYELPAQFRSAMLGVNGLTCSACSRSVEMAIRKLPFVEQVEMNLENTEGKIFFKEATEVDIEKLARAVINAGFSVRYLTAVYHFQPKNDILGKCILNDNVAFHVIDFAHTKLAGDVTLTFLGAIYQPKKEFNKIAPLLNNSCEANTKKYFVKL